MRVGILGGVFNPPHIGHLIFAQEALLKLELATVVFIPVGEAPHKQLEEDPGAEARLEMCEYAVAPDDRFGLSRMEIDRAGPSYAVDTLRELHDQRPGDEFLLLLGGDTAAAIAKWREPEEVLRLATPAVVERTGWRREPVAVKMAGVKGVERTVFFDMPRIDVSSTMVRRRAAAGKPIRYLVPDRVASFIAEEKLYGASAAAVGR